MLILLGLFGVLCFALWLLARSSDWFFQGLIVFLLNFRLSAGIFFFLPAIATSLPESFINLIAISDGNVQLAIFNVLGSNVANAGFITGLIFILFSNFQLKSLLFWRLQSAFLLFSLLLWGIGWYFHLSLWLNMTLMFSGLVIWMLGQMLFLRTVRLKLKLQTNDMVPQDNEISEPMSPKHAWLMLVGGIIVILIASKLTLYSVLELGHLAGLSEIFLGVLIVAIGTSLPEAAVSLRSFQKKHPDIGLASIMQSNLINAFLLLSLSYGFMLFKGQTLFDPSLDLSPFNLGLITLTLFSSALVLGINASSLKEKSRRLIRLLLGALMIIGYLVYVILLFQSDRTQFEERSQPDAFTQHPVKSIHR